MLKRQSNKAYILSILNGREISKKITAIIAGLVIIGVTLSGCIGEEKGKITTEGKGISVTTDVGEKDGSVVLEVSVKGKPDSYTLTLSGPERNTIDTTYIAIGDMGDGSETVWLSLSYYKTTPESGTYTLAITSPVEVVYRKEFKLNSQAVIENYGPLRWSPNWDYYEGRYKYTPDSVNVTINNKGNLPLYISGVKVTINEITAEWYPHHSGDPLGLVSSAEVVLPGEIKTIEVEHYGSYGFFDEGTCSVTYEVMQQMSEEEIVVGTMTTTANIP